MKPFILENLAFYIDYLVGALFVLFHTATRFNTPPTNRSSTTAAGISSVLQPIPPSPSASISSSNSPFCVTAPSNSFPGESCSVS